MADLIEAVRRTFWSEKFWLPDEMSWESMKNHNPNIYKPQLTDLWSPVYLCLFICIIRIIFERIDGCCRHVQATLYEVIDFRDDNKKTSVTSGPCLWVRRATAHQNAVLLTDIVTSAHKDSRKCVAAVVGRLYNLRSKVKRAPANPIMEKAYTKYKVPDQQLLESLSKQTDLTTRQVERWFRIRRNQDRTPVMKKFCESSWRCTYYAAMFCYGLYTLWDKPWLWDTSYCWNGWPEHHVSMDVYWYYTVQAGFYLALSLSLFTDHKRKDFTEMIVHHCATLGLMFLSWMVNFTRVGTLVLLVHDCVDPLMEAAKMAKYLKKEALCTALFVFFLLTWVVTRMMLYPFKIIRSTLYQAVPVVGMCDIYYLFNGLLITLQVLHVIWFYFILIITKEALFTGQLKKDSRSSDESITDEEQSSDSKSSSKTKVLTDKNGLKFLEQNGRSAHRISKK